jgi:hypothetical protein
MPPEYCASDKKDTTECKAWLKAHHPLLYEEVYPELGLGEEEEKKDGDKPLKKKKKVGFGGAT